MLSSLLTGLIGWAQETHIEFFTPSIVHVVKSVDGKLPNSLVVTAKPEEVKVTKRGTTTSSSLLTVKLDERTGALTFLTAKGKVLLREKSCSFNPVATNDSPGKHRINQTFLLDKDEAIYGLGTIQNGKMNRRG